jgi:hypothetical protein
MGILWLVVAAYLADKYEKPFHITGLCVLLDILSAAKDGEGISEIILGAGGFAIFCSIYFLTLIKFTDNLVIWLLVLIGFPLALFMIPIVS